MKRVTKATRSRLERKGFTVTNKAKPSAAEPKKKAKRAKAQIKPSIALQPAPATLPPEKPADPSPGFHRPGGKPVPASPGSTQTAALMAVADSSREVVAVAKEMVAAVKEVAKPRPVVPMRYTFFRDERDITTHIDSSELK